MEDKRLVRVFDQVKLSPDREEAMLAELLREKEEVSGMRQKNGRRRITAAALIAAVLVAALTGTAVAREYLRKADVFPLEGGYENGYKVHGVYENIPMECLSEEALEYAAQEGSGRVMREFSSWEAAEEFLGLELANNPMLDEMAASEWRLPMAEHLTQEDLRICDLEMHCDRGKPGLIMLYTSYSDDDSPAGPFIVNVNAILRVKDEATGNLSLTVGSRISEVTSTEEYMTPSGIEVSIVNCETTVTRAADGTTFQQSEYIAYFHLNKVMFEVKTHYNEENAEATLKLLKEILDNYQ